MKHKNIILVGMMGSGKTTIGQILLQNLDGFDFFDTDKQIEKAEKQSINKIFELKGEEYFRKLETKITEDLINSKDLIISTGGGLFVKDENVQNLKMCGIVFYLKSSAEELAKRLENDKSRPLLKNEELTIKLKELLAAREKHYEKADYTINTTNKSIEEITKEIIEKYKKDERTNRQN